MHTLGELGRERGFGRIELETRSREELASLATVTAGERTAKGVIDVHWQKTRGNPLFVLELLRSIGLGVGGTPDPDAVRRAREMAVPPNVRAVIRRRFEGLSPQCTEVLVTAAAMGSEIDMHLLARVMEAPQRRSTPLR